MCVGPLAPKVPQTPALPPLPPPLPPAPDTSDADITATLSSERQKRRLQASLAQGRGSNVKTSALGLTEPAAGLKAALGT